MAERGSARATGRVAAVRRAGWLLVLALAGCAPAATTDGSGGRAEDAVASRNRPAESAADSLHASATGVPLEDARAVYGTIDLSTGRRTTESAVDERMSEPVRTDIQSGRLRQASEPSEGAAPLPIGFRVQVTATPDFAVAGAQATRVKEALHDRDPVYVEFIDPYYKVRVGDFPTQEAAQPALGEIRALGYSDAWVVRTTIKQGGP